MTATTRSARTEAAQVQRRAIRSIIRAIRKRQDPSSAARQRVHYWTGTFEGWETADANLMQVLHPSGELHRYVPTLYHVKNTGTWTTGTTLVRVCQYGNQCWAEGQPIGDPTVAQS